MTWDKTYSHALAIGVDMLGSALFFSNTGADITISSMCGLELRKQKLGRPYTRRLVVLGHVLNWIQKGHCEMAISADIARCSSAVMVLEATP